LKKIHKMTKQNVEVSDCASRVGMVRLTQSKSPLFSPAVPEPPAALGGNIAISQKKVLKRLEISGGGVNISAWVDSIRASSPTRIKSPASLPETEEQSSWTVSVNNVIYLHPSWLVTLPYMLLLSFVC
jgi:trehalose 6-phosphate phosphatase